jgi:hypothetical protein
VWLPGWVVAAAFCLSISLGTWSPFLVEGGGTHEKHHVTGAQFSVMGVGFGLNSFTNLPGGSEKLQSSIQVLRQFLDSSPSVEILCWAPAPVSSLSPEGGKSDS